MALSLAINGLDASGVEMLSALIEELRKKGIVVAFCSVKPHVRKVIERTGLVERIGAANMYDSESAALRGLAGRIEAAAAH